MNTAFLLGSQTAISMAELQSVYPLAVFEKSGTIAFSSLSFAEVKASFTTLGGSVRAFEILQPSLDIFDIMPLIKQYVSQHATKGKKTKIAFFAQHAAFGKRNFMKWMTEIKSFAKQKDISLRVANRGDQNLDCNAVDKEHLLDDGNAEFVIAEYNEKFVLMRTIAVQEVWKFITRDIKKPIRDMQVGMLPPKLARIMINLSRTNGVLPKKIYDPFCGTGTILLEAIDLGVESIGSDLSDAMQQASEQNTDWFCSVAKTSNIPQVFVKDAAKPFSSDQKKILQPMPIAIPIAIVSEGYLGHIYSQPLSEGMLQKETGILFPLYQNFLRVMSHEESIQQMVFGFPFWKTSFGKYSFLSDILAKNPQWKCIKTLRYLRDDQVVGREIAILQRV